MYRKPTVRTVLATLGDWLLRSGGRRRRGIERTEDDCDGQVFLPEDDTRQDSRVGVRGVRVARGNVFIVLGVEPAGGPRLAVLVARRYQFTVR